MNLRRGEKHIVGLVDSYRDLGKILLILFTVETWYTSQNVQTKKDTEKNYYSKLYIHISPYLYCLTPCANSNIDIMFSLKESYNTDKIIKHNVQNTCFTSV